MLKGKTNDRIKQIRAGNNLSDRLFNIPIERETETRLFEKIFCIESAGANGVRSGYFVTNSFLLSSVIVKNGHVRDVLERETRKVSAE